MSLIALDELKNYFNEPSYRPVIKQLTQELLAYGKKYIDPRIHLQKIKTEMQNAIK